VTLEPRFDSSVEKTMITSSQGEAQVEKGVELGVGLGALK